MSITGKQLYDKIRGLRPDLSSGITSEILSKTYDNPSAQPFLKWFCKNVSNANILFDEEMKLKCRLQDTDEWLEDTDALDTAVEEATKDCPDLLRLVDNLDDKEDLLAEYKELQESCREDEEYLCLLRNSVKNLKEIENKLDDDIEEAETALGREQIEAEKAYDDCSTILKEFDRNNCQFSKDVEALLNVYTNASKNQGDTILWSQIPTDLFVKQMELYNQYLEIYLRKQFGNPNKEQQNKDSDYSSLMNDSSREKQVHEKMHELTLCKTNLTDSTIQEIGAAMQEKSVMAMLQCAQDIYNDGILKISKDIQLQDEIHALTTKRNFLEQSVEVLQEQKMSEITYFMEMKILNILKNDTLAHLERRKLRIEKLKTLFFLAGKHVHVDLLCILIQMQRHCLHQAVEFIADARHYLATEYKLSSTRCEMMQQQQDEYTTLVTQSADSCNMFNQIFISMMLGDEPSDGSLSSALKKYDDLLADNAEKKKSIVESYLNNKVDELKELENKIDKDYMAEIQSGPTISLKPISYEISSKYDVISTLVSELQEDITRIRSQFKERMRMDANLEREKDILWQRFLADPDTLRMKYEEAKQKANESHFGDSSAGKMSP